MKMRAIFSLLDSRYAVRIAVLLVLLPALTAMFSRGGMPLASRAELEKVMASLAGLLTSPFLVPRAPSELSLSFSLGAS